MRKNPMTPEQGESSAAALWTTCRIVNDVVSGQPPREQYRSRSTGEADGAFFVGGHAELDVFIGYRPEAGHRGHRAADRRDDAMGFAVMMASGPALAYRPGNRARSARKAWQHQTAGEILVGAEGILLRSDTLSGGWMLDWSSIQQCEVVDLHTIVFATNRDRRIRRLRSSWSELAFALWVIRESPWNLQFTLGTWLPADWPQPPRLQIFEAQPFEQDNSSNTTGG